MIKGYQPIGNIIGIKNEYGSTRLLVDNSWSFAVPQGFTYTTDTTPIKQSGGIDLSGRGDGCYVALRHGGDYDPDIEFCLKDNSGYGSVEETRNDDSAETGYASCVSYQIPCDEGDFIVGVGVYGMPLFNTLIMGCFRIRVRYKKHRSYDFEVWDIGDNLEDAKMYARELVNSIRVEDRDLSNKPGEVGEGEEATPDLSDFFLHALNAGGVANIKYDNEYSVASDNVLERKGKKLLRYNGSDTAIIIPEGFTSIGSDAFAHGENNYHIHGIVIPEGVTKLDEDCMALCASLTEVKLPSTLKKIGSGAFQYSGIEEVNIPDHVESIGDYAFFHCRSLKHLIIPESVKSIGEEAFDFMGVPLIGEQTEKPVIELPQYLYDDKEQFDKFYTDTAVFKPYKASDSAGKSQRKPKGKNEKKVTGGITNGEAASDEVKMFVILNIDEQCGYLNRTNDDFYHLYKGCFKGLKKKDILNLRKSTAKKLYDMDYIAKCREKFKAVSTVEKFNISTKNYFSINVNTLDANQRADEAVDNTSRWYEDFELSVVRSLMDDELDKIKSQLDKEMRRLNPDWTNWYTAKQYLKINIHCTGESEVETLDDCQLFQVVRNFQGDELQIEVFLGILGTIKKVMTVKDSLPMYWGVSYEDIWKVAINNEIVDWWCTHCEERLAREALETVKKKHPDAMMLRKLEESAKESSSNKFIKEISTLYNNAAHFDDSRVSKADIKKLLDDYFKSPDYLLQCKEYIIYGIRKLDMRVLNDLLNNEADALKLYQEIPEQLSEDINTTYEKAKKERQEKERKDRIDKARKAVASTKKSIEQLEGNIKDNTAKLADLNAQFEEKQTTLKEERDNFDSFIEEEKEKWRANNDELKEEISDSKMYIEKLQEQINEKKHELSTLSFLHFGKKKELTQIIEGLTKEVQQEQSNRDQLVSKRNSAEKEYHSKVDAPQNRINNMASIASSLKNDIDTLSGRIESDKKALEEKTGKLPELEKNLEELEMENKDKY